jgi:subtilisin family serine protease
VLVGVIDTGIDWRHADFRNADGTTRVAAFWDAADDSFATSGGRVGSAPPMTFGRDGDGKPLPLGTLYTRAQINAALKGAGTVNGGDVGGHGTACAGIAAGNGRGTANGVPAGTYPGVATGAELLVARALDVRGGAQGAALERAYQWMVEEAKKAGKPLVVNMSLGSHYTICDGNSALEKWMARVVPPNTPGVLTCVSAGNGGDLSLHARARYGPRRPGQRDITSEPMAFVIGGEQTFLGAFSHADDWGLMITGDALRDEAAAAGDNPEGEYALIVQHYAGEDDVFLGARALTRENVPDLTEILQDWAGRVEFEPGSATAADRLEFRLAGGNYQARAFCPDTTRRPTNPRPAVVKTGTADLYLTRRFVGGFVLRATRETNLVEPGNSERVITVGSYDFRGAWPSLEGPSSYNLVPGALSTFSSAGPRRDGLVKPEVVAPGRFAVSSLARGSEMGDDRAAITPDGLHVAWEGTSAASPYVAGVLALLLEREPRLTLEQARARLKQTALARPDAHTGALPNPAWGYGRLQPGLLLESARGRR